MSRTSKAAYRLGVAGVAAVTMGAGLPALLATGAAAAPAAQLSISPAPGQAAAGTCQVFTVTAVDSAGNPATYDSTTTPTATPSVTIQVTESPESDNQRVSFCDIDAPFANLSEDNDGVAGAGDADTELTDGDTATFVTDQLARTTTGGNPATATGPTTAQFGIRGLVPGGANIRAFLDDGDNTFEAGELQALTSTTFTAGGNNSDENEAGGNAAQDAAASITDNSRNSTSYVAGTPATFSVQVRNAAGNPLSGVVVNARIVSGPNGPVAATTTSSAQPATAVSPIAETPVTDNTGTIIFSYTPQTSRGSGTDNIQVFVNQTSGSTSGPDAGEPTLTIQRTITPTPVAASQARNVAITPTAQTTVAGQNRTFTVSVTSAEGAPATGVSVEVTEEGPGRFSSGLSTFTGETDNTGTVTFTTTSVAGESGTQILTARITELGTECANAAGSPSTGDAAGNCSVTTTQTFVASTPSPSPSPTATATATATATPTPTVTNTANPGLRQLVLDVQNDTITPGVQGVITITGTPNREIEVLAYSRPSTTYQVVRRVSLGEDGTAVIRILPGTNTRLYARYTGVVNSDSQSVVQNVATALSLTVVRNGSRDYTFQGRILPRRAGQLITLYRVLDDGREIITSQIRTDNTGTYRIRRVFTGSGTFGFLTRTGQNLTNVAGVSNGGQARPTAIYAGPQR